MIQIRKGVFETNSSSTHSLALDCDFEDNKVYKEEAIQSLISLGATTYEYYKSKLNLGTIPEHIWEFGWQKEVHNDFGTKFLYALKSYENDPIKLNLILREVCNKLDLSYLLLPCEYSMHRNETEINFHLPGYIDHDSCGMLQSSLEYLGIDVIEFLFHDKYLLILDSEG